LLQVAHAVAHVVLQQIPDTQMPLAHRSDWAHAVPLMLVPVQMFEAQLLLAH
jgi:hypothetical protein